MNKKELEDLGIDIDNTMDWVINDVFYFVPNGHIVYVSMENGEITGQFLDKENELILLSDNHMNYSNKLKLKDFICFANKHIDIVYQLIDYDCAYSIQKVLCSQKSAEERKNETLNKDIDYLYLSKRIEKVQKNGITTYYSLDQWILDGMADKPMEGSKSENDKERYALDICFIDNLMDCSFVVSNKGQIFNTTQYVEKSGLNQIDVRNNIEAVVNAEEIEQFVVDSYPALLTILSVIFESFNIMGNDEDKQNLIDQLKQRIEDFHDDYS